MPGPYPALSYFTSEKVEAKQCQVSVKVTHPGPPKSLYAVNSVSES